MRLPDVYFRRKAKAAKVNAKLRAEKNYLIDVGVHKRGYLVQVYTFNERQMRALVKALGPVLEAIP